MSKAANADGGKKGKGKDKSKGEQLSVKTGDGDGKSPSSSPRAKSPNSMAERRKKAMEAKKERERLEQEQKEREEAEKREAALAKRQKMKEADEKSRQQFEEVDGQYFCDVCGELVDKDVFVEHFVAHPSQIRERIWLGAGPNAVDASFIEKAGITHVLNCTIEIELVPAVEKLIKGFKRVALTDRTTSDLNAHMRDAIEWTDEALSDKDSIFFVHCREGKSRSVSFLCAYIMWKEGVTFESALASVQSKRPIAQPNSKFMAQLQEMSQVLAAEKEVDPEKRTYPPSKHSFKLKAVQKKPKGAKKG